MPQPSPDAAAPPAPDSLRSPRAGRAGNRPAGKLVAIALVAMGMAAAWGTYAYWKANWRHYREVRIGPGGASSPTAGTTDPQAVEREAQELMALGHRVLEEYRQKDGPPPPAELVRDVGAFVERRPDHAECRELHATLLIAVNRLDEGYAQLLILLKTQTQRGDLQLLAGTVAKDRGDWAAAERHYRDAVAVDALNPAAHVHLASVLTHRGEFDPARDALLTALRLDDAQHKAYRGLSEVFAKQGKLVPALTQIDKAIERVPEKDREAAITYVRFKAMLLRRDNKPAEALHTLLYSLTADEQAIESVVDDLALCLTMDGRYAQAASLFEGQMRLRPFDPRPAREAARLRLKAGDREAAARHLEALKRIDPRQPAIAELQAQLQAQPQAQPTPPQTPATP
jgi:tetratricopeptide (TPR) repeat protein